MTVRNSYQESNILKMHFASLRLCAKLGSQRRRDAKSIKDKGCEKYSTTNLFCERVLVTDSHINFLKGNLTTSEKILILLYVGSYKSNTYLEKKIFKFGIINSLVTVGGVKIGGVTEEEYMKHIRKLMDRNQR